jgi:glycine/D-amino acid oxidase-like deaminating enzyme/nitrite reductase/ring-hydroxylating ferredoxin subunit
MKSTTPWQRVKMPQFPRLTHNTKCDVLIAGGGITGLSAAWLLKSAGKRVAVLERSRIGSGDTGCTTAHLTQVTDGRVSKLVSTFGRDVARLVWEGEAAAINTIEQIARTVDADCNFRRIPAFVHLPIDGKDQDAEALQEDARLANELGFAASLMPDVPHIEKPGICFPNQAKFHPLRYLRALAKAVDGDGSMIFEQSEAMEFSEKPRVVKTEKGQVECDYLVIATHVPLVGEAGLIGATLLQTKLAPYTTYAIGAQIPKGRWSEASYFDTADPYHYLRIDEGEGHDYAILGGEDHKTGQADDVEERHARLEELLKKLVPSCKVDHRWSGQVIETHDGLPYIGETASGQFAATGFSGNGMTFGTLAAMMACDAVCDRRNPWKEIFDVNRKKVQSAWDFVKENVDYPYYLVRDRLAAAGAASTDEVKRGEGKILRQGATRVACSRDEDGKLSSVSAVCTHMGCLVHWNPVERTWDCPCHGSRFLATGEVLAGPAESPLEPADAPVKAATG